VSLVAGRRARSVSSLHLTRRRNGLQAGVLDDHRFELRGLLAAGCCHPVSGGSRHHAACAEHGDRRGHLIDLEFHVLPPLSSLLLASDSRKGGWRTECDMVSRDNQPR
jgi:hypothetical protein